MDNLDTNFDREWNYSDPVSTRLKFKDFLNKGNNKDYNLQLKTQIARTYSLMAEFKEAHDILDEVEKELGEDTLIASIRYFLERGRTYNSDNKKVEAKSNFLKAYEASVLLKLDKYTIDSIHMIAIAATNMEEKLKWTEKGISIARGVSDDKLKRWVGIFLNNSGWDLFEAGRFDEALERFKECEAFHKASGNTNSYYIAIWSVGKTYRFLGQYEESLKIQESLLREKDGKDEGGYVYEELAELYLLMGSKEKARVFFAKAYAILSKDIWLKKNESKRLERLKKLSL